METEASENLYRAAYLIEMVLPKLDTNTEVCSCCGLSVKNNFVDFKIHTDLQAISKRLRGYAEVKKVPEEEEK